MYTQAGREILPSIKTKCVINLINIEYLLFPKEDGLFSVEWEPWTMTCSGYALDEMDCSCLGLLYIGEHCSSSLTYSMNYLNYFLSRCTQYKLLEDAL